MGKPESSGSPALPTNLNIAGYRKKAEHASHLKERGINKNAWALVPIFLIFLAQQ